MNTAHLHLMLNHLPIIGTLIGTLVLVSGFILKNNNIIKQTALGIFVFSALAAIPAFFTGEGAEDLVEGLPGVSEVFIETHEELAKTFLIAVIILGILSLVTFVLSGWYKSKLANVFFVIVLVTSIGVNFLGKNVGTSGGEIRHTEIRGNNTATNTAAPIEQKNDTDSDDD